jgi:hypothetical protein
MMDEGFAVKLDGSVLLIICLKKECRASSPGSFEWERLLSKERALGAIKE